MPINVKVSTTHPHLSQLFLRQTPNCSGKWGDCQFFINNEDIFYDWWFVCHAGAIQTSQHAMCDPDHIVYISMEPAELSSCDGFYKQFSHLVLCEEGFRHPSVIYRNGLTWWAGINVEFNAGHQFQPRVNFNYDSFKSMKLPESKQDRISVITSSKSVMPGHEKRLNFIEKLRKSRIAHLFDFYGGGTRPVLDKLEAILPYKYHLVLENSVVNHYWTEKLADSFLGFAYPIYYGCQNVDRYFSHASYCSINIDSNRIIETIESVVSQDLYSKRILDIQRSRAMVLDDYNIFELMSSIATCRAKTVKQCNLLPQAKFFSKSAYLTKAIAKISSYIKKVY